MKQRKLVWLALIVFAGSLLLSSCKKKEGFDMDLKLQTCERDMLLDLSGNSVDSLFLLAVKTADSLVETDTGDYFGLFYKGWKLKSPDSLFKPIFLPKMKEKTDSIASEEGVIDWMRKEYKVAINKTAEVLKKRFDDYDLYDFNVRVSDTIGFIFVRLEGVKDTAGALKLVHAQGKLNFWETYEFADVYEYYTKADAVLHAIMERAAARRKTDSTAVDSLGGEKVGGEQTEAQKYAFEHPLFARLSLALVKDKGGFKPDKGPVVGIGKIRDTAKFHQLLKYPSVKEIFPPELKMAWTVKPVDEKEKKLQLLALKVNAETKGAALCGCVVDDAEVKVEEGGSPEIWLSMNEEGTAAWKAITEKNIGKSIAIVFDDYVYAFPVVQTVIDKGESVITGAFTKEEAEVLALILRLDPMPLKVTIMDMVVTGEPVPVEEK